MSNPINAVFPFTLTNSVTEEIRRGALNVSMTLEQPDDEHGNGGRVFVSLCDDLMDELGYATPPHGNRGENPGNDKLWDAYNAAEVEVMKDAAAKAVDFLVQTEQIKITNPHATPRFSKRAGCAMCDCSPGIVDLRFSGRDVVLSIDAIHVEAEPTFTLADLRALVRKVLDGIDSGDITSRTNEVSITNDFIGSRR